MTIRIVTPQTETSAELASHLGGLLDAHGCTFEIQYSPDGETPLPFGVWAVPSETEGNGTADGPDLIGVGVVMSEALSDAVRTARGWEGGAL